MHEASADSSEFSPEFWKKCRSDMLTKTSEIIEQGKEVLLIVDDNFELQSMRKPYVKLAQTHKAKILFLFFDVPLQECC